MKKISLVIPNFNGLALLTKNLPKINRMFKGEEIIVVDDASTDESVLFIKNNFPHIKILSNKKNLGFASTVNRGIFAAKNKLVFLLNNDCLPRNNFLSIIYPYFKDEKTFAVGCLEKRGSHFRGRGVGGFRKGLFFHQPGMPDKNNTLWVFGAAAFYNRNIFEKLGGFDENFNPFYWEDFDLSYRALKSGYKIYFEKRALVYHQCAATINKNYSAVEVKKISFRNQILTTWKNISDWYLWFNHLFWLPYHLIWTTFKTKGLFLRAFLEALMRLNKIIKLRKKNKFIFSDKEVLAPFIKEIS